MKGWFAVYYRELLILKRRFFRQAASMSVSPVLYIVAFGFGMGKDVTLHGRPYIEFLIPGLMAMTSMTQAFAIASEINIARFYWRIFEEFQAAPISHLAYVTGEVMAGLTRALLSCFIIIGLSFMIGVFLSYDVYFWVAMGLNALFFASLAVCFAMLVRSHADQMLLSNFIITPMGFLGGTFFPVERMPIWAQKLLSILPITHATSAMRIAAFGGRPEVWSYLLLLVLWIIAFGAAVRMVKKAMD
ncbi:MAG: ABC transporter permease [Dissulfurimicrobium sp.]|uniref:ABC transporter permease n=1 Tax=Dissulfurimicrobium TaxID=1769732 RepID=UPI001EDAB991|nr:ABC transporter permease [Dissulfurimicrobium hydrothermale]UKL13974.1 ABC transporter permease [Dissulfurimicrobium hydrothermale]